MPKSRYGKICMLPECDRVAVGHGLCSTHYEFARRNGLPRLTQKAKGTFCSIEGCGKEAYAKGWCRNHHARYMRSGVPVNPRGHKRWAYRAPSPCRISGCDRLTHPYSREKLCVYHLQRKCKTGDPTSPVAFRTVRGKEGESSVAEILTIYGHDAKRAGHRDKFDLLVDGKWKIEVKCAAPATKFSKRKGTLRFWRVNFHRHGKMDEQADLYVIKLLDFDGSEPAFILMRSPYGSPTALWMEASIRQNWKQEMDNFWHFCKGEMGIIEDMWAKGWAA